MGNLYPCVMACANASTSLTGIFRVTVLCSVPSALTKYQSEGYARCLKVSLSLELKFPSLKMWDKSPFHSTLPFNWEIFMGVPLQRYRATAQSAPERSAHTAPRRSGCSPASRACVPVPRTDGKGDMYCLDS